MNTLPLSRLVCASGGVLLLLSGCGGGGDSSTAQPESPPAEVQLFDLSAQCPVRAPSHLFIETEGQQPIVSKDDYVRANMVWRDAAGALVDEAIGTRIRGRGNSTWDMPKKPYRLKLDQQTELLGLSTGRDWAMLANYADKSLLRNELAFCMARTLGLPYTPGSSTTEVTLNGQYDGIYQLTNKAYPLEDRMEADAEASAPSTDAATFSDAFILEIDWILRQDHWFYSVGGIPWNFDSDTDAEQRTRIEAWINELESIIMDSSDPQRYEKVSDRLDVQSLVDFFLLSELTANPDAYLSSTYAYRTQDGRLTFGPVWDFDQAQGLTDQNLSPEGWLFERRPHSWYVKSLLEEPQFRELLRTRWAWMAERVPSFMKFAQDSAHALDAAQARNFQRWPILGDLVFTNVVAHGSYAAEVEYLISWTNQRAAWINDHIGPIAP